MRRLFSALAKPFTETTGLARWMLVVGVLVTAVFVICAIFAPWLAPYGFAQSSAHGVEFPKLGSPQLGAPLRHGPVCSSTSSPA